MLSSLALVASSAFYLVISYYNLFDHEGLLRIYNLNPQVYTLNPLSITALRSFGVAAFILSFIMAHMIKHVEKHSAAVRTALMTTICFALLHGHRLYLDVSTPEAGKAASYQLFCANLGLSAINLVALMRLPAEKPKKSD
jgi:hypothetical protein